MRWVAGLCLVSALLLAAVSAPAQRGAGGAETGATLAGRVELLDRGGHLPARGESVEDVVVWFEPLWPQPEQTGPGAVAGRAELETRNKEFVPRVLPVSAGTTVRFPNRDPILHNAFSVSRGNSFDLGLAGRGPGAEVVFDRPGVVRVFCNVHHDMVAYILVLDTPYFSRPDERGRFVLRGVPPGPGTLHAWHERAEEAAAPATVSEPSPSAPREPVQLRLEVTKPRIPPHLNKFGRRYGHSRDRYQ